MIHRNLAAALAAGSTVLGAVGVTGLASEDRAPDPVAYIRRALQETPIVCLTEGGHQALEPHLFLRRVLADEGVLASVDVVIIEFAASHHQAVLDAYIEGEDVPFAKLSSVWRDTCQSPIAPWDSPLYHELLEVIRAANRRLPPGKRARVIAGDPPLDWERIKTREEYAAARIHRSSYVADLAIEQAFHLDKKVLILFGGAHLPKVPVGPEDPRNSVTHRILSRHPDSVRAIGFLSPENLGVEARMDELVQDTVYSTDRHWVGEIGAELFFPKILSLVTDEDTGEKAWKEVPLYSEYRVRDLFDALVYIGPSSTWQVVPASFDPDRDAAYLAELDRRSLIRFGRPLRSGR